MKEVHNRKKNRWLRPAIMAFIMPVMILLILYIIRGVFPFGEKIYVRMDFYHQYAPFVKEFCRRISDGGSLFYAWEMGLGTNYWAHFAYYLASPFNWLLVLIPDAYVIEAMNFTMVLRAGIAGSAMVCFLKEEHKENPIMAAFGTFYALSGYYLAYSCNIIWMDGFALFPLVALGVLRIAKGKSAKMYIISMLICIFSNFYLAVIIGMCSVIWFVMQLITGGQNELKHIAKAIVKFVASATLCVSMCAVILLPAAHALMNTPAGDSAFPEKTEFYFTIFQLFERMCMNTDAVLKGSDLPNIYASVLVLLLVPVYFINRRIGLKNKIVYGFALVFLLFGFSFNYLDYIWHGFHFPNSFPARQSFFYIFLVLVMGYEVFSKRKGMKKAVLPIVTGGLLILLAVAWIFLGKDDLYAGTHIYLCTMIFVLVYGLLLFAEKYMPMKLFMILFLVFCCAETGIHTLVSGMDSVVTRSAYMEDDTETELLLELIMPEEDAFYRIEEQDRRCVNDAAWDGYYGASYFSSTMPAGVKEWYDAFGFRNSSVSYSHDGATPLTTSLLGIRYVFACEDEYCPGNHFETMEYAVGEDHLFLYENKTALPLGYVVDSGLEERFLYDSLNPFMTQNQYATAVLNEDVILFDEVEQYKENNVYEWGLSAGVQDSMEDDLYEDAERVSISIPAGNNVFLYVTTYMEAVKIEIRNIETGETETVEYDDLKFKKILSVGVEDEDRIITVSSADPGVTELEFLSYKLNEDVLWKVYETLNAQPMEIVSFTETKLTGLIDVKEKGELLLSIPYDEGWKATVDGVEVEIYAWKNAFLALEAEEGEHEIQLIYCPRGFKGGLIISLVAFIIAIAGCSISFYTSHGKAGNTGKGKIK